MGPSISGPHLIACVAHPTEYLRMEDLMIRNRIHRVIPIVVLAAYGWSQSVAQSPSGCTFRKVQIQTDYTSVYASTIRTRSWEPITQARRPRQRSSCTTKL